MHKHEKTLGVMNISQYIMCDIGNDFINISLKKEVFLRDNIVGRVVV